MTDFLWGWFLWRPFSSLNDNEKTILTSVKTRLIVFSNIGKHDNPSKYRDVSTIRVHIYKTSVRSVLSMRDEPVL